MSFCAWTCCLNSKICLRTSRYSVIPFIFAKYAWISGNLVFAVTLSRNVIIRYLWSSSWYKKGGRNYIQWIESASYPLQRARTTEREDLSSSLRNFGRKHQLRALLIQSSSESLDSVVCCWNLVFQIKRIGIHRISSLVLLKWYESDIFTVYSDINSTNYSISSDSSWNFLV